MKHRERTRPHATTTLVSTVTLALTLTLAATTACTATEPAPDPRPVIDRDTISAAELGDELVITARVVHTLGDTSFVVQDADLPTGGLLVVAGRTVEVRPPMLVTVRGTVRTFHYANHPNAGLGPRPPYETFEGQRAVMADSVTVWSGSAPSTTSGRTA